MDKRMMDKEQEIVAIRAFLAKSWGNTPEDVTLKEIQAFINHNDYFDPLMAALDSMETRSNCHT